MKLFERINSTAKLMEELERAKDVAAMYQRRCDSLLERMQEDSTAREEAEQLRINCDALRRQLDAADEHSRFLEKAITVLQKDRAKWKQMYSVSEDERRKVVQERDELRTRIKAC